MYMYAAGVDFITEDLFGELSDKEDKYLTQKLDSRRVATPKLLLIKPHKDPLPDGSFPTRLVIPADGFMAGFGKMAFLALKRLFDDHNVVYMDRQIEQACSLKCDMEERRHVRGDVTIASIDVEKMHPSTRFSLLSQAVKYFARNLSREDCMSISWHRSPIGRNSSSQNRNSHRFEVISAPRIVGQTKDDSE